MAKPLVIVESPAKARTIARFLGNDYLVESSIGHVRDLPRSAAEVPPKYKGTEMGRLGVDVEHGFEPVYVVPKEKKQQVAKLKSLLKDASELYLATDEDREGESIAWHLLEVLSPRVPVRRMVFHEITEQAIAEAVGNPRELRGQLVEAQEARRILDRLYGYEVSPVLWKKVMPRLSAGRVQSVATRILVERERERMAFQAASYWDLEGTFEKPGDAQTFSATLVELDGRRLATGKDFTGRGELSRSDAVVLGEADANALVQRLDGADFAVRSVEERPYRRSPAAPFITSTLQQEAGRKLGFTAQRAMRAAQSLYENGYITYMRTDSTTLSDQALQAARTLVSERYGADYLPAQPRRYEKKVKNAQEAHEAIRPAGERFRLPEDVSREVGSDEARLYELVFRRTVASQMEDARGRTVTLRLGATSSQGEDAEFAASGTVITFAGFRRAYEEGRDDADVPAAEQERVLPDVGEGDALRALELAANGHETQPPARFTEASLVKALEEMGVGRPSTYASIIGTILDRGYAWKKGSALVPTWLAFSVVTLLENFFDELVDYRFTARMEDDLDEIANGDAQATPWLSRFYFGNGQPGLKQLVESNLGEIDAREVNSIPIGKDAEGEPIVVRVGRYGPYLQRGEDTTSVPEELAPDELTVERALELLAQPSGDRVLGTDPDTALPIVARAGRFGPYVQVGDPESGEKPRKTASLFKTMSLDTVTVDEALRLLSLPRVVGVDPDDGQEITAQNGRYGPYIKKGTDSRSLASEEDLFTVTLEQAKAIFAEPKRRGRGAATAKGPLRELGDDPATGKPMVIKDGRFGPYITDGEYNVTVPKSESVEAISAERAADLLAEKRAKGPAPKKRGGAKKAAAPKKAAAKKSAAKKK